LRNSACHHVLFDDPAPQWRKEVVEQEASIDFLRVSANQCHASAQAASETLRNDRIPVERGFVGENDIAWFRLNSPRPSRKVFFGNVPYVGQVKMAVVGYILDAQEDWTGIRRLWRRMWAIIQALVKLADRN
jgi:hypothetical protein